MPFLKDNAGKDLVVADFEVKLENIYSQKPSADGTPTPLEISSLDDGVKQVFRAKNILLPAEKIPEGAKPLQQAFFDRVVHPLVKGEAVLSSSQYLLPKSSSQDPNAPTHTGVSVDIENGSGVMKFKPQEVLAGIEELLKEHFPNDPVIIESFQKKYDEMVALREAIMNSPAKAKGAEDLANFRMAAWLSEELNLLQELDASKKQLEISNKRLINIQSVETKKGAVASAQQAIAMIDGAVGVGAKSELVTAPDSDVVWQPKIYDAKVAVSRDRVAVENAKRAFLSGLSNEHYQESDLAPAKPLPNEVAKARYEAAAAVARASYHPFTKGLFTDTNPTKTSTWKQYSQYRNALISKMCNTSNYNEIKGILEKLKDDQARGFITNEEFKSLFAFAQKQVDEADVEQKERLKKLETCITDLNQKILDKIEKNEVKGDDLNKIRMLQLFLICSPFMPISVVPTILGAFAPFFNGSLGIADFAGSFFSVNGPFGQFAVITDALGIDDAVTGFLHLFSGVLSVPEAILQNTPVGTMFSAVSGAGTFPLAPWALAAAVEVATNYTTREIEYQQEKAGILPGAEKKLNEDLGKLGSKDNSDRKESREVKTKRMTEHREDLTVAMKVSTWLQDQSSRNSEVCNELLKRIFGDVDAKKITDILDVIKGDGSAQVKEGKKEELLEILRMLKFAERNEPKAPEVPANAQDPMYLMQKAKYDADKKVYDEKSKERQQFADLLGLASADQDRLLKEVITPIKEKFAAASKAFGPNMKDALAPGETAIKIEDFDVKAAPKEYIIEVTIETIPGKTQSLFYKLSSKDPEFEANLDILRAIDGKKISDDVEIKVGAKSTIFNVRNLVRVLDPLVSASGAENKSPEQLFDGDKIKEEFQPKTYIVEVDHLGSKKYVTIAENNPDRATILTDLQALNGLQDSVKSVLDAKVGNVIKDVDLDVEKQKLADVSLFVEAESLGIEHLYLPAKGRRLIWRDLSENLDEKVIKNLGLATYKNGDQFHSQACTQENLDKMILLYCLKNSDKPEHKKIYADLEKDGLPPKSPGSNEKMSLADFVMNGGISKAEQQKMVGFYVGVKVEFLEEQADGTMAKVPGLVNRGDLLIIEEDKFLKLKGTGDIASRRQEAKEYVRKLDGDQIQKQADEIRAEYQEQLSSPNPSVLKTSADFVRGEVQKKNVARLADPNPNVHVKEVKKVEAEVRRIR